jgi:hypothetical protein
MVILGVLLCSIRRDSMSLWDYEEKPVSDYLDVPRWVESDITCLDVAAVCQGGCASGAYMPAVTYWQAMATMNEHSDAIERYLDDSGMDILESIAYDHWAGVACTVVSSAVELWCSSIEEELLELLEADEEVDDDEDIDDRGNEE